jgi:hypothetical protein
VTAPGVAGDGNAVIQAGFDPAAVGAVKALCVEESGLFVVLTLIAAAILSRGRWPCEEYKRTAIRNY